MPHRTTCRWSRPARPRAATQPLVELTYNWDTEDYGEARYFGHLAYEVDDIYAVCERLMKAGVTINRPPRDGVMAFVRSPDKHSIELLQKGDAAAAEGTLDVDGEHRQLVSARQGPGRPSWPDRPGPSLARSGKGLYISPRFRHLPPLAGVPSPRPSSSGPGHRPFTAVTRVRVP